MVEVVSSERVAKLILESVPKADDAGGDVMGLLEEAVGGQAAHYVQMFEDELGDMDGADLWDLKNGGFEAGLKIGLEVASLPVGSLVVSASVCPDDHEDVSGYWTFWFVTSSEDALVEELREGILDWLEEERRENGMLPFREA